MKHSKHMEHESYPDMHHDTYSKTVFGFWVYLMTDLVLFGTLFATYAVLSNSTFGGPSAKDLFYLPFTLIETLVLLFSSFTIGIAGAAAHRKEKKMCITFFAITFVLGAVFMGMMWNELSSLVRAGHGWDQSAFLSSYFTLMGTLGLHVLFGLLWMIVLLIPVWRQGISHVSLRRLTCLKMFWQFLNIIWVLIFSFVYLMGVKVG